MDTCETINKRGLQRAIVSQGSHVVQAGATPDSTHLISWPTIIYYLCPRVQLNEMKTLKPCLSFVEKIRHQCKVNTYLPNLG